NNPAGSTCADESAEKRRVAPEPGSSPRAPPGKIGDTLTDNGGLTLANSDAFGTISLYLFRPAVNFADLRTAVYSSSGVAASGAGGTISVYLFKPGDNCSDLGTAVYSSAGVADSGNGTYHSAVGTTNTDGNVTIRAVIVPGVAMYAGAYHNNPAGSTCADE